MVLKHSTVLEAYTVLGLEHGTSLEVVRNTYKQLALKTHPDKNPESEDATAQFQRISEAYNVLQKHLAQPPPRNAHSHFQAYQYSFDDEDMMDDDDEYYDDSDYYESESDDSDRLFYYMWMFEQLHQNRRATYTRYQRRRPEQTVPETNEQYSARMRRVREEQEQAEARRVEKEASRKAALEEERAQLRKEAEQRQRVKAESKKAQAAASRKDAEEKANAQKVRLQTLRSDIFAAARRGDSSRVKKGLWEEGVDATGGEVKKGAESFVNIAPEDPLETLMHIAAKNGDTDLVEWLDAHSADPEEQDSAGFTAFHSALKGGHIAILRYFFKSYPPQDSDYGQIYASPASVSVIRLALETGEPEIVWMILDHRLAPEKDMSDAWTHFNSAEGKSTILRVPGDKQREEKYDEIRNLLMSYGGFTPPCSDHASQEEAPKVNSQKGVTPNQKRKGQRRQSKASNSGSRNASSSPHSQPVVAQPPLAPPPLHKEGRQRRPPKQQRQPVGSSPVSPTYTPGQPPSGDQANLTNAHFRPPFPNGRGRGRGRGGWSRGRARGPAPITRVATA